MKQKIGKKTKGFTLLEILLVIAAIGILAAIVLVAINPNRQIAQVRNAVRQADINTIQKALEQYLIEKGSYPVGITSTYKEICNTGSNNTTQGTVSSGCIDLRELVPDYLASIPVNPSTSTHNGYYAWINDVNKKIAVLAGKGENGKIIGVNNLKENIVTDGLVLYLDAGNPASYPGTGNTWFDLSGNGNNGTLVNGVGYNSDNGGSLSFDGVDDHIYFSSNPSLTNQITVEVWVKLSSTSPFGIGWILGREGSYRMLYNSSLFTWVCATTNNGWYTTGTAIDAAFLSPYTQTYQVVGTYDGSNNRIYVNGELKDTGANISGNILANNNYNLMRSEAQVEYGKGNFYSHKLYNRALTAAEVQQNYNVTRGRFGL